MSTRTSTGTTLEPRARVRSPAPAGAAPQRRGGRGSPWRTWLLEPGPSVAAACASTLLLHLLFLSRELTSDEGGFAMVARRWWAAGPYLYGHQWVDRPPGLMVVFHAAQGLGPYGVRLTAGIVATVLVAAAAWGAHTVGGPRAATWGAWTAFAFATTPLLDAYQLNGELIAAGLVMVSAAATLRALRPAALAVASREGGARTAVRTGGFGLLGGAAAAAAVLVKQDFVDGLAFAAVLLVVGAATHRYSVRRVVVPAAAIVAGAAGPLAGAVIWAVSHDRLGALLYAAYGFRADAADVIAGGSLDRPEHRLVVLLAAAAVSGLLPLAAWLVCTQRRALLAGSPVAWAVVSAASIEVLGMALGGSYWRHYLIAIIPMLALATGVVASGAGRVAARTRLVALAAVVATSLAVAVGAVAVHVHRSEPYQVGRWLAASAHPADTVVVPFTHPNVIQASGLGSPYPYSWSLPVRTLDPELTLLTGTLDRQHGSPTWVVRWDRPHTWGLDSAHTVERALRAHYRQVAIVCGHPVWLHDGIHREVPAAPAGCSGT